MSSSAAKMLACRSLREFRAVPSGPYHPAGVFKAMAQDNRTDLVGNGGHISVRRGSARQGDHPFPQKPLQLFPVRCAAKNKALLLEDAGKGRHGGTLVLKKVLPQFPGLVAPRTDCSHAHLPVRKRVPDRRGWPLRSGTRCLILLQGTRGVLDTLSGGPLASPGRPGRSDRSGRPARPHPAARGSGRPRPAAAVPCAPECCPGAVFPRAGIFPCAQ